MPSCGNQILVESDRWGGTPLDQLLCHARKPSGAIGTAVAQQSLRGVPCFCNAPRMNTVEACIQFKPGLVTAEGAQRAAASPSDRPRSAKASSLACQTAMLCSAAKG